MKHSPLTVVIPVFNTAQYLERCLQSVVNQTEPCLDIIIINDGSTDNSEKIIEKYLEKYKYIKYIKLQENIGVGNARNIGITNSATDYIAFVDSDDWIDVTFYKRMLQSINKYSTDVCIAGIKTEVDDIYNWEYRYKYPDNFTTDGSFCLHSLTKLYNTDINISPIVNNKIYNKKTLLENNIFFDASRRAQDVYFSFMIFVYAKRVSFCNDTFYHYYQRNLSATHNFNEHYINDYFYILSSLKTELELRKIYPIYLNEYEAYVKHYLTKLINNMFRNVQSSLLQKNYIIYILKKANKIIPIERLISFVDVEKFKRFWEM